MNRNKITRCLIFFYVFVPQMYKLFFNFAHKSQKNHQQLITNYTIMAKFIDEFKEFALKGNVVDMAVGVIIGGAFGKIVSSVVADLIMPLFAAMGGVNASDLKITLKEAVMNGEEVVSEAVTWNYGAFIQNVIDFLIIAICLFCIIKGIAKASSKFKKEEEAAPAEPEPEPEPTKEEVLLTEIRDLLAKK